eukprot:6077010-Amphidinium_carterae.1
MVRMIDMATTTSTNKMNMRSTTSSTPIYTTRQKTSHDVKSIYKSVNKDKATTTDDKHNGSQGETK